MSTWCLSHWVWYAALYLLAVECCFVSHWVWYAALNLAGCGVQLCSVQGELSKLHIYYLILYLSTLEVSTLYPYMLEVGEPLAI
jgi:hypothetical protein